MIDWKIKLLASAETLDMLWLFLHNIHHSSMHSHKTLSSSTHMQRCWCSGSCFCSLASSKPRTWSLSVYCGTDPAHKVMHHQRHFVVCVAHWVWKTLTGVISAALILNVLLISIWIQLVHIFWSARRSQETGSSISYLWLSESLQVASLLFLPFFSLTQ